MKIVIAIKVRFGIVIRIFFGRRFFGQWSGRNWNSLSSFNPTTCSTKVELRHQYVHTERNEKGESLESKQTSIYAKGNAFWYKFNFHTHRMFWFGYPSLPNGSKKLFDNSKSPLKKCVKSAHNGIERLPNPEYSETGANHTNESTNIWTS